MAAVDLRLELRCSICIEIYTEPVTLSCGHSFCSFCIRCTWDFRESRDKTCPECNHSFWRRPQVKRNLKLHNIAEAFRHQQQLEEAQETQRGDLQEVLKTLSSRKETYTKNIQALLDKIRQLQKKNEEISKIIRTLFEKIQEQIWTLEQKVLSAISSRYQQTTLPVQDLILKVEKRKDELYKDIRHHINGTSDTEPGTRDYSGTIERQETPSDGISNTEPGTRDYDGTIKRPETPSDGIYNTEPGTRDYDGTIERPETPSDGIYNTEPGTRDYDGTIERPETPSDGIYNTEPGTRDCDGTIERPETPSDGIYNTEPGTRDYDGTIERPETPSDGAGDQELGLIAEILHTGLSDIHKRIFIEEPTNIYLDIKALRVPMSRNLESSCQELYNCSIQETSMSLHPYNKKLHNIAEAFNQLVEAQEEIPGGQLRDVLKTLFSKKENCGKILQTLEDERRELQKNVEEISKKIRTLFIDIDQYIKILEKKVMGAISSWYDQVTMPVYGCIIKMEMKKDELDKEIKHHIDGMSNMEPGTRDYRDTIERPVEDTETPGDLELSLISEILSTGLTDLIAGICIKEPTNIYLNIKTPHTPPFNDLESSSEIRGNCNTPESPRRLQLHPQALNTSVIFSGQHAWKVESSDPGVWRVGVYYFSMHSTSGQFSIGNNEKSWCLRRYKSRYTAMHDRNVTHIPYVSATNRLKMELDYEAGQLSFYELGDPIRHLHTFTTTFSEPLHAAFYVWRNSDSKCFWMDIVEL